MQNLKQERHGTEARRRARARASSLFLSTALVLAWAGGQAQAQSLSESAGGEIRDVLTAKELLTPAQRKMSSDLVEQLPSPQAEALRNAAGRSAPPPSRDVLVDITADVSPALQDRIRSSGGVIIESVPEYNSVRARVPADKLEEIASSPEVRSVRSADIAETRKATITEGVQAHAVDDARARFGADGTGVSVGVLSDAVDSLQALQAEQELPQVDVLPGQAGSGGSEGTAMLEIVNGMAPGTELHFATAFNGIASFARNIRELQKRGCKIIVDDISYFREPVFEDGAIAQAVDGVAGNGVQYYSSAGNSGSLDHGTGGVWEGDFTPGPVPPVLAGLGEVHAFKPGVVGDEIVKDSPSVITLQWSDHFGHSGNDYDLFLLDRNMTHIIARSVTAQDGNGDPFEQITSGGVDHTGMVLAVVRKTGAAGRYLELNANRGRLAITTAGQTSGHSAAEGAFSVAAVNVAEAGQGRFSGGPGTRAEPFSSDGPRRIFYKPDGNPVTPGNLGSTGGVLRRKPDIAAADGVRTATPGFDPFFGTSAAAPHAAAIGALLLQENPSLTPAGIRALYEAKALDIEASGRDAVSGAGIVMADDLLEAVAKLASQGAGGSAARLSAEPAIVPTEGGRATASEPR